MAGYNKIPALGSLEYGLTKENFGQLNDAVFDLKKSKGPKYLLVSDGVTVTGYDWEGATVSTGTDGGAVLTACLPAAASVGAHIEFRNDGNLFPWGSVPLLPKGITGKLIIRGNGVQVTLNSAGKRFLGCNRIADYDTFQNFEITDFVIDRNNVAAASHESIIGNKASGDYTQRSNVANVSVRRVKIINVPFGNQSALIYGIDFGSHHLATGEVTQTTLTDILYEDCEVQGGDLGFAVMGSGATPSVNVFYDHIRWVRLKWDRGVTPTVTQTSGNQIGSRGFGGSFYAEGLNFKNAADTGLEVGAATESTVRDSEIADSWNANYYLNNFASPKTPSEQTSRIVDCVSRTSYINNAPPIQVDNQGGVAYGDVIIDGLTHYESGGARNGSVMYLLGTIRKVSLHKIRLFVDVGAYVGAGNVFANMIRLGFTNACPVHMRDVLLRITGSRGGSGTLNYRGLFHSASAILDIDDFSYDNQLTGLSSGTVTGLSLGAAASSTVRGLVRRFKMLGHGDDVSPTAISVGASANLTITGRLDIEDADFTAMSAGTEVSVGDNTNKAKTFLSGLLWRTFPKPSAAMGTTNFVAGTFTTTVGNQYIGGSPAEIHFATGTGSGITAIDVAKDGATYENAYTQASGAMAQSVLVPVDNGDSIKVTFATTQPTTRVRFRK